MKNNSKLELGLLAILLLLFLFIRSVYYVDHLNFSGDQATHSAMAMKLWEDKKITLIGNQITSIKLGLRMIFQGPFVYYFMLLFLIPANFDPIIASYLFTIFCSLMIFPLYFGIKTLISKRSALIITIIYCFSPYYLEYTRFLWNPNSQFALIPLLLFSMARLKENKSWINMLFVSILLGLMLQLHYQFILVIFGLFIYYISIEKFNLKQISLFFLGITIGISPLILFELRNNFYNLNTIYLFITNWNDVERVASSSIPHYYLSTSFFVIVLVLYLFINVIEKLNKKLFIYGVFVLGIFLFTYSASINFHKPTSSFWASVANWNYQDDFKIYENIKQTGIKKDFNIANLTYDAKSMVVKYLLRRDKYDINYDDYYGNKYLFVISKPNVYEKDPAYEVDLFKPRRLLRSWKINNFYEMYLLERLPKQP
jgi:hypothetical protein